MPQQFLKIPSIGRLVFLLLVVVPAVSWFAVKPVRVLVPILAGVSCAGTQVCVDDESQREAATALYVEAKEFVSGRVGASSTKSRVIFCSRKDCSDSFGMGDRSALTVGTFGTVISPHAWKPFYVRHELIHQLQGERLGVLPMLLKPGWLIEGMAYAMSDDPRPVLSQPWERDRQEFQSSLTKVGPDHMWDEASRQ